MEDAHEIVVARLRSAGVEFEVLRHEAVYTMDDVERALRLPVMAGVKSVAVAVREGGPVVCGVHATARLDLRAVADALDIARSRLKLLPPDQVADRLGALPGAVGLVTPEPASMLLDRSFEQQSEIYFGSGDHERTLKVGRASLVKAFNIPYVEMEMQ